MLVSLQVWSIISFHCGLKSILYYVHERNSPDSSSRLFSHSILPICITVAIRQVNRRGRRSRAPFLFQRIGHNGGFIVNHKRVEIDTGMPFSFLPVSLHDKPMNIQVTQNLRAWRPRHAVKRPIHARITAHRVVAPYKDAEKFGQLYPSCVCRACPLPSAWQSIIS